MGTDVGTDIVGTFVGDDWVGSLVGDDKAFLWERIL